MPDNGLTTWRTGDVIPVRHVWRSAVWYAHPAIVVDDAPERLIVYEPVGSVRQWSFFDHQSGVITPPRPQTRHTTP